MVDSRTTTRSSRWQIRVPDSSDSLVREAAELEGEELSTFVEHAALDRAQDLLAERNVFRVDADEYEAFLHALDAPPRDNPRLRRLLSRPAPWE
jgi:uncharacterized protein (DUF1778 family)